jgi:hypothetical protein
VNTPHLDCDQIRLARFIEKPCIKVSNGVGAGTLLNGSYMVAIAYSLYGVKISDYYISNIQPLFNHNNAACSLDVELTNVDQSFSEMQVVLISVTNQQTVARLAGTYTTGQSRLSFDTIDNTWPAVPIDNIPIMTPIVEKTDAMYTVTDYLIRTGTTSKEDFNYQPLANQIVALWQSTEYPADYYRKGGNQTGYLRDEIYSFFIQWIYDTGDKSSAYHIPGRPGGTNQLGVNDWATISGPDADPELVAGLTPYRWVVYNTALQTGTPGTILPDGGVVIAEGIMGYWESTELYPNDQPDIWNSNIPTTPYAPIIVPTNQSGTVLPIPGEAHNLCGKPIRHHKFPDLNTSKQCEYTNQYNNPLTPSVRIMGVKFENIQAPLLNNGAPVPGIVGYEILRGTRNGNKTILAKGLINNMRQYRLPTDDNTKELNGYYPNYPYNETGPDTGQVQDPVTGYWTGFGRPDPFMSETEVEGKTCGLFGGNGDQEKGYVAQTQYSKSVFTFHSPDTNFTDPFLSAKEIKIHGEFNGNVQGQFELSEKHPKEKLITNAAFIMAAIGGLGIASLAMFGERSINYIQPQSPGYSSAQVIPPTTTIVSPNPADALTIGTRNAFLLGLSNAYEITNEATLAAALASGVDATFALSQLTTTGLNGNPLESWLAFSTNPANNAFSTSQQNITQPDTSYSKIPFILRAANLIPTFLNFYTQGTDSLIEFFRSISRYQDFALRYHSHGHYSNYVAPDLSKNNTRRVIKEQVYLGPQITDLNSKVRINNLYRSKTVAIGVQTTLGGQAIENTLVNDVTRIRCTNVDKLLEKEFPNIVGSSFVPKQPTGKPFDKNATYIYSGGFTPGNNGVQIAASHYASLKQRIRNQYGQINGITLVPASYCSFLPPRVNGVPAKSGVVFGGDTYIGRYTEKNTFFHFYNWLYGQPDGAQFDYTRNEMLPYPRFWANFNQFETGDFMASLGSFLTLTPSATGLILPSDYRNLDGLVCHGSSNDPFHISGSLLATRFSTRYAWFYLFNSGVKDFYVESEINVDLRDWGNLDSELFYDPYRYTDTKSLFDTLIIKAGNYYKYDQSLSIAKLWYNYGSWAAVQDRFYNPYLAETCYIYRPNKVIYSLPNQFENVKDNWSVFLPNNYYNFSTRVTCIKPVNKNGALIFFDAASPVQFLGLDQLQTTAGTKLTIGDGGLFSQPMQNIVNADRPYEYASCQDRLSVINTPAGIYWISQNQGKIFNYAAGLTEVSMKDMKWWFALYLPYKLTDSFPNFELTDNPVIGIGCQSIFDNENGLLYFTKRDFIVRTDLPLGVSLVYIGADNFWVQYGGVNQFQVKLGDPEYFEDASWTTSYDPKTENWISYHDWHPSLLIPGKNTFLSVKDNGIWIHNEACDSYCNYYGKDYPFEIEYMVDTIQQVNTVRSVEYQMEIYKYANNCFDRFHILDANFDEAVVFNTEQVSGLLNLVLEPKNDPQAILGYPQINFNSIDVLYSKVENKYRFNQFWDITDDRGEYNPSAQRMIWNTGANGYVKVLNPANLNYTKDQFQRKKFRHYTNTVFLRRKVSGDKKILVILTNNKNLFSPR